MSDSSHNTRVSRLVKGRCLPLGPLPPNPLDPWLGSKHSKGALRVMATRGLTAPRLPLQSILHVFLIHGLAQDLTRKKRLLIMHNCWAIISASIIDRHSSQHRSLARVLRCGTCKATWMQMIDWDYTFGIFWWIFL